MWSVVSIVVKKKQLIPIIFINLHPLLISEKSPELIPEIATENKKAANENSIDGDVDDQPNMVGIGNHIRSIWHDIIWNDGEKTHQEADVVAQPANLVRFCHLNKDVPELVLNIEIRGLSIS